MVFKKEKTSHRLLGGDISVFFVVGNNSYYSNTNRTYFYSYNAKTRKTKRISQSLFYEKLLYYKENGGKLK